VPILSWHTDIYKFELSVLADGGIAIPVAFENRFVRNGRGAPSAVVPPLKAQSGQTGKGDAAPLVVARSPRRLTRRGCRCALAAIHA
jgi:hypothetical protein